MISSFLFQHKNRQTQTISKNGSIFRRSSLFFFTIGFYLLGNISSSFSEPLLHFVCPKGPLEKSCQALVKIYYSSSHWPKIFQTSWLRSQDICSWEGVGCNEEKDQVIRLDLPKAGPKSFSPEDFYAFSLLQEPSLGTYDLLWRQDRSYPHFLTGFRFSVKLPELRCKKHKGSEEAKHHEKKPT